MISSQTIGRVLLVLNAVLHLYLGYMYIAGAADNRWKALDDLFVPNFTAKCHGSGTSQCWLGLAPFYGSAGLALGVITLAAVTFGRYEGAVVLIGSAVSHGAMAYVRLTVIPSQLYNPGKAEQASRTQGILAAVNVLIALAMLLGASDKKNKVE